MLHIQNLDSKKGLTSKEDFGVIPLGDKGEVTPFVLSNGGTVTLDYGASIKDSDRRSALTCISLMLSRLGYEQLNTIIQNPIPMFRDSGQVAYTTFSIKASDISTVLYGKNDEGRLIAKSLKKVAHLQISIDGANGKAQNVFNQMQNIAYKNGMITFDVANILVMHLAETRLPFRLSKTLLHVGFDYRLSFYIETHQYKAGKNWYPQQTYRLDDLLDGLKLRGKYRNSESKQVEVIQKAFDNIASKDDAFPQYRYDDINKWFYNKYKKSASKNLFE